MYEAEVEKLQGARITLEQQKMSLEGAAVNIEVFKAVESGVQASMTSFPLSPSLLPIHVIHVYIYITYMSVLVKGMRGNLDAARVDRVMDDIEEEKDLSDQISEAITRPAQDMFNDVRFPLICIIILLFEFEICVVGGAAK